MNNDMVAIQVVGVVPTQRGCAVFLGNEKKTFTIYVENTVGQAISMFMSGVNKERPLTHDLIGHIFAGLGVTVERILINDLKKDTFFARIFLKQENGLGIKILAVDARPSDSLALAVQSKSPIFVARKVLDKVEDMTEFLKNINEMQSQAAAGGEPEEAMPDMPFSSPDMDHPDPSDFAGGEDKP